MPAWRFRTTSRDTDQWGTAWLKCRGSIVASVAGTVFPDGRWIAYVNRHRGSATRHPHAYFCSQAVGMRSVERWAGAHAMRLLGEVETGGCQRSPGHPHFREGKRIAPKLRG